MESSSALPFCCLTCFQYGYTDTEVYTSTFQFSLSIVPLLRHSTVINPTSVSKYFSIAVLGTVPWGLSQIESWVTAPWNSNKKQVIIGHFPSLWSALILSWWLGSRSSSQPIHCCRCHWIFEKHWLQCFSESSKPNTCELVSQRKTRIFTTQVQGICIKFPTLHNTSNMSYKEHQCNNELH